MNDLVARDLDKIWHPYTQMKTAQCRAAPFRIVRVEADGLP